MAAVIDDTVGGANANSYEDLAYAAAYFDSRLLLTPPWIPEGDMPTRLLIMGTRTLDALAQPFKTYVPGANGTTGYFIARRQWTGRAATSTQRLAWPRIGMFDANGNPISPDVIPDALKDGLAELSGQLLAADRTLDNDVIVQGITAVKAGSVSVNFKDQIMPQVIPDAVYNLFPQSWLTSETISYPDTAIFEVVPTSSRRHGYR